MKLPENFKPALETLVAQLYGLLPESARPHDENSLITEAQISQDEEIHRVQRSYNMAWLKLNHVLPGIESIDSEEKLKEHLFKKQRPIFEQYSHIWIDHIRRAIPEEYRTPSTSSLISQKQLVTEDMNTLFMQLAYNIFYVCAIEIPRQKECTSPQEFGWHYLNESQRIVDQVALPALTYICSFLSDADKPLKLGKIIVNEKLSQDLKIQFFQRIYNIGCLLSNEIFPHLQGKCHSVEDLMTHLANPIIHNVSKTQLMPFLHASLQSFIDELYRLFPKENRPKTSGRIIKIARLKKAPFKENADLQFVAALYNVACQIKNNILPRIEKIDSFTIFELIKLGWDLLDEVKLLLNYLIPVLEQMKVFFIDDLHAKLPEDARATQCGEFIPDEKLSKTDGDTFFTQKFYNLACFIFNQIIPGVKSCFFSTQILWFLGKQSSNFIQHFNFIGDLISNDKIKFGNSLVITYTQGITLLKEILQPVSTLTERFFGNIQPLINNLASFFAPLIKETVKFTNLSIALVKSLQAPLVTGDLSYYAVCYIHESAKTLDKLLRENMPLKLDETGLNEKKCLLTLRENFKNTNLIDTWFGLSLQDENENEESSTITENLMKWWSELLKILNINSFSTHQTPPFVPQEITFLNAQANTLIDKYNALRDDLLASSFDISPTNWKKTENQIDEFYLKYTTLLSEHKMFMQQLATLPKTPFITFSNFEGKIRQKIIQLLDDYQSNIGGLEKNQDKIKTWVSNKKEKIEKIKSEQNIKLIDPPTQPLIQKIENQQVELNTAHAKEIEQLEKEISILEFKVKNFEKAICEIQELENNQKIELENFSKIVYSPNQRILELIEQSNSLSHELDLPLISSNTHSNLENEVSYLLSNSSEESSTSSEETLSEETSTEIFSPRPPLPSNPTHVITKKSLEILLKQAKTTEAFEKISTILEPMTEIDITVKQSLGKIIEQAKQEKNLEQKNDLLGAAKDLVVTAAATLPTRPPKLTHLNLLLTKLNKEVAQHMEEAQKRVSEFKKSCTASLEIEYEKLYRDIPSDKKPTNPHAYLDSLKKEIELKQMELDLAQCIIRLNTDKEIALEKQALFNDLSDPYNKLSENISERIHSVITKCPEISGHWILNILTEISKVKAPANKKEQDHLIAQQTRAVFVVNQLVSRLDSIDKALELKALVETKHADDTNPYGFIRRELDLFRFKYGNTRPWEQIMTCIQNRLNTLAKDSLTPEQYENGKKIMETHVQHDYGFGFFYTPRIAHQWETQYTSPQPTLI